MAQLRFGAKIKAARVQLERLGRSQRRTALPANTMAALAETLEKLRSAEEEAQAESKELLAARQALEARCRRYQELFELAPDAHLLTDAAGTIVEANRAAARLLNRRRDSLQRKPLAVFVCPEQRPVFRQQLSRLEKGQDKGGQEWIVRLQPTSDDGSGFDAALVATAVSDASGRLTGVRWLVRDVSERIRVEEALRRERDFAESLIETAQVIVLVLDSRGRIVRFNPFFEEVSGYSLSEVQGHDWFATFLPQRDRQRIRELFETAVSGARVQGNINPIVTKHGHEREIEWYTKTLTDPGGSVLGVLAVGHDITERLCAAQRLSAQYAVTRVLAASPSLAEATPALLQAICEGLGWQLGELWHLDAASQELRWDGMWHVPSLDATEFQAASSRSVFQIAGGLPGRVWASGRAVCIPDVTADEGFHRSSIVIKLGLPHACAFPLGNGHEVIGVMAFYRRDLRRCSRETLDTLESLGKQIGDFIVRKRAEAELAVSQRLVQQRERLADIGAITAQIIHDLGNPLAGVSMQAQLIARRASRDPDRPVSTVRAAAERIVAEAHRLNTLIAEFRDFAREQRLELKTIAVPRFVQEVIDLWQPLAAARGITLATRAADRAAASLVADEDKLRRVLDNLVKNALEAIEQGPGCVSIEVSALAQDRVRISVSDTGPGLPASVQLFRLFETTKPHGTGLGLAVARQMVQAHGGNLTFAPVQPHGATFHVDLPRGAVGEF
ncbi:MAG: PAS domain S-box protein [Deltaproteobacteria bacterium]|nr:PAS domain S-box protein [Deltaproteobacteria bacterium]